MKKGKCLTAAHKCFKDRAMTALTRSRAICISGIIIIG
jgi:hypothetical protein